MRQMNVVGKPYEGEPHVRFEVAGAGDGSLDTAPALDPTSLLGSWRGVRALQQAREGSVAARRKPRFWVLSHA